MVDVVEMDNDDFWAKTGDERSGWEVCDSVGTRLAWCETERLADVILDYAENDCRLHSEVEKKRLDLYGDVDLVAELRKRGYVCLRGDKNEQSKIVLTPQSKAHLAADEFPDATMNIVKVSIVGLVFLFGFALGSGWI